MTALYSGDIDMIFSSAIEALGHARDGRMRVLGIGAAEAHAGAARHAARSASSCPAMS